MNFSKVIIEPSNFLEVPINIGGWRQCSRRSI
jgi:hypothetical protein